VAGIPTIYEERVQKSLDCCRAPYQYGHCRAPKTPCSRAITSIVRIDIPGVLVFFIPDKYHFIKRFNKIDIHDNFDILVFSATYTYHTILKRCFSKLSALFKYAMWPL
jgi:hypothetical protein